MLKLFTLNLRLSPTLDIERKARNGAEFLPPR